MTDTWIELATHLKDGDTVVFTAPIEYGAHGAIPKGTIATVVENGLNEMACAVVVKATGDDGEVYIPGPGNDSAAWNTTAIITRT